MDRAAWSCAEARAGEIETLLEGSPQLNPFSTAAFLQAVRTLSGGEELSLIVRKGGEPVAGFRGFLRRGRAGREACPPPFGFLHTPFLRMPPDPLAERRSSDFLAAAEVLTEALEKRTDASTLILHPTLRDVRPFQWKGWRTTVRYTWRIALGDPRSAQEASADDVRQSARQAAKAGLEATPSEDLAEATDLWMATSERQGIAPGGSREDLLEFFESLRSAGLLSLWAARKQGRMLAAVWLLSSSGWTGYWLAANSEEGMKTGANAFLIWRLLETLAPQGGVLDLCGADLASVSHFKGKFGGRLTEQYLVEKAWGVRARLRSALR